MGSAPCAAALHMAVGALLTFHRLGCRMVWDCACRCLEWQADQTGYAARVPFCKEIWNAGELPMQAA